MIPPEEREKKKESDKFIFLQSLEARKMAEISIKLAKVEEATRKKDEITNEFITQTKEQLETKMETHVEKREAIISDMKEKLKVNCERKHIEREGN